MSHNQIKIAGQSPNVSSEITLNIADIGSFTSTTNKQLGFNASGDLVQLDPPTSSGFKWIPSYNYFGRQTSWGGGSSLSVGDRLAIRKTSGTLTRDVNYASDLFNGSSNSTWANQFRLQAGTYLLNGSFSGRVQSSSDECILRVKNETDNSFHGNHTFWGASQYSNNMYAYVTISAPKTFSFMIEAVSGSPFFISNVTLQYIHLNIWRFA
jgi:hypothetical protein